MSKLVAVFVTSGTTTGQSTQRKVIRRTGAGMTNGFFDIHIDVIEYLTFSIMGYQVGNFDYLVIVLHGSIAPSIYFI